MNLSTARLPLPEKPPVCSHTYKLLFPLLPGVVSHLARKGFQEETPGCVQVRVSPWLGLGSNINHRQRPAEDGWLTEGPVLSERRPQLGVASPSRSPQSLLPAGSRPPCKHQQQASPLCIALDAFKRS